MIYTTGLKIKKYLRQRHSGSKEAKMNRYITGKGMTMVRVRLTERRLRGMRSREICD